VSVVESVFLWTAPALALTHPIVEGVLARHPGLRIGVVELSAVWVPLLLMMLDGGHGFVSRLNGRPRVALEGKPSDYFRRQVRVSCFAYERPERLIDQAGDLFVCCSDDLHSEGTAQSWADYRSPGRHGVGPEDQPGFGAPRARPSVPRPWERTASARRRRPGAEGT